MFYLPLLAMSLMVAPEAPEEPTARMMLEEGPVAYIEAVLEVASPDPVPFSQSEFVREIEEAVSASLEEEAQEEAEVPEPDPAPEPEPDPEPEPARSDLPSGEVAEPWQSLADCESGNWINGGASFERNSARWYWAKPGTEVPPWGTTIHHGGLQFHPGTWDAFRLDGFPQYAYDASPQQQVQVAERVLEAQGWGAWPTCARKLGLR